MTMRSDEDFLPFLAFVLFLFALYATGAFGRACRPRLVAIVLECSATSCQVIVADGTKGTAKAPVKPGDFVEVCQ